MSGAIRCLGNSLRSSRLAARISPGALPQGVRSYGQAAVRQREDVGEGQAPVNAAPPRKQRSTPAERPYTSGRPVSTDPEDPVFANYLNRLMHPLTFSPELSRRIMTHSSHALARKGHNGGLSFFGRRVLNTYTLLFLQASPNLPKDADIEDITSRTVHTSLLGQHLGGAWGIGREMVWAPSLPAGTEELEALRHAGLYKVQGEIIQAVVGAVYHQYGGSVAHRLYHTRILPNILTKGGLPMMFHDEVHSIAERIGGAEAPLLQESR
ncbi:hypothetical protein D9619_010729 [Psilocybe cf. subviscida]|uniref:RNase III domain-containing protein n=1 Tax=Psilocybe cf. subviscida TaxID=2480587 RepID=A0A8H5EZU7_9AGAR|nr:hypothetical protein D9619_010729 [Psilocybe cf. subviscida]